MIAVHINQVYLHRLSTSEHIIVLINVQFQSEGCYSVNDYLKFAQFTMGLSGASEVAREVICQLALYSNQAISAMIGLVP